MNLATTVVTLLLGLTLGASTPPAPVAASPRPPAEAVQVPLRADDPARGATPGKVTVVAFSDFQCPFCARADATVQRLLDASPGTVRVVWKHLPLSMHAEAVPAARAAEAARLQGRFWEMHDRLLASQASLAGARYLEAATALGLDLARFQADAASQDTLARIAADQTLAGAVGARGTPTFFVNCRRLVGAQPLEAFQAVVAEESRKADAMLARGVKPADLYTGLCAENVAAASAPRAASPARAPAAVTVRTDDPVRGDRTTRVTVVEFSDFQCPFCARAVPAVRALDADRKVRLVWKHLPLPFHPSAMPAALAAEAAREQGRFWEMHDKLFSDQSRLSEATYLRYASELGLDLKRFEEALTSPRLRARVQEDLATARAAGITGTPTFLVDGEVVVGSGGLDAAVQRRLAALR
jgi:protein-disulfide isomerase